MGVALATFGRMKLLVRGCLVGMAAFLLGALPARAQDAKAAETFVTALYARYRTQPDFSPFVDVRATRAIATPSLTDLVGREQAASRAAHEESKLDYDPLSGSQDSEGLQLADLRVELTKPGQAVATATLRFGQDRQTRRLLLAAVGSEWRIDDITDAKGGEGLRETLNHALASHRSAHRR